MTNHLESIFLNLIVYHAQRKFSCGFRKQLTSSEADGFQVCRYLSPITSFDWLKAIIARSTQCSNIRTVIVEQVSLVEVFFGLETWKTKILFRYCMNNAVHLHTLKIGNNWPKWSVDSKWHLFTSRNDICSFDKMCCVHRYWILLSP